MRRAGGAPAAPAAAAVAAGAIAAPPPPKAPPSPWMFYEDTNNWWYAMAGINVVHGLFLLYALWSQPARDSHERSLRLLAITYLAGCAWRC